MILASSHGRRSVDTFQEFDPSKANWECQWTLEGDLVKLTHDDQM